jgi:alpha-1,2-mannosyltransferase
MPSTDRWRALALALATIFVAVNTLHVLNPNKGGDADVFFDGGRRLLHGLPLYEGSSAAAGFVGPPFQAIFFTPFAAIDAVNRQFARLLWYAVNLVCLAAGIRWTLRAWAATRKRLGLSCSPWLPGLFAPLAAVLMPLQTNFEHQNMNAVLLGLLTAAMSRLTSGSAILAGVLVGVATALKAFPALLIAYFAIRRHWDACVAALVTAIVLTFVPALVYGPSGSIETLGTFFRIAGSGWPTRGNNQSLLAAISRLIEPSTSTGVDGVGGAPLVIGLFVVAALALVAAAVVVLISRAISAAVPAEMAAAITLAVLLAPIAWDHYWVLVLPSFVILYYSNDLWPQARIVFWTAAILTTGLSPLIVGQSGFNAARRLSTYTFAGLLLYWALLQICRRASVLYEDNHPGADGANDVQRG